MSLSVIFINLNGDIMKKYDFIVAGGGLSGVAAAVCASREGLNVLLIEKNGCLGGSISNNLVYPFMPYWTLDPENGERKYLSSGIFEEMRELEKKYNVTCGDFEYNPEYYKFILDELVVNANVEVLFHASVFDVNTQDMFIKSIKVLTRSGVLTFEADFFCDATGNGDLFALADCEYQLGRESDGLCQPMTTCFRMGGVNIEQFKKDIPMLQKKYKEYKQEGKITNPRENILLNLGIANDIVHFNTTRIIRHNPIDAFELSRAEISARCQVYEMERFLKENSVAFKDSIIISIANEIGIRESRKLKGCYILTEEDLKNTVDFEDSIALGNYDIDIHNPSGSGTSHYYFKQGEYYRIPYRALLPKEYENLLVAGRCISATHQAQASIRIMPICACLGQAAGVAAATAFHSGKTAHTVDVKAVRAKLIESGAAL